MLNVAKDSFCLTKIAFSETSSVKVEKKMFLAKINLPSGKRYKCILSESFTGTMVVKAFYLRSFQEFVLLQGKRPYDT